MRPRPERGDDAVFGPARDRNGLLRLELEERVHHAPASGRPEEAIRIRSFAAGAFAALLLSLVALPTPVAGELSLCTDPQELPGVGTACPVEGGFLVPLAGGGAVFTHGPDPIPVPRLLPPGADMPSAEPVCVTDPSEPAIRVSYVRAFDDFDRYDTEVHAIRAAVRYSNAIVLTEALALGADIRLKVRCDESGEILVARVTVPTPQREATFSTIANDMQAQGFGDSLTKEWVVYDGSVACNCGGQSAMWWDDRPGANNWNNRGGLFSFTYLDNYGGGILDYQAYLNEVMLHELGHNLGAVQWSAPNTSGAAHCNDGADIMCYADGGSRSNYSDWICPAATSAIGRSVVAYGRAFDCNHDDYFHPFPPAGSYLATHWNVASPVNRFVERVDL